MKKKILYILLILTSFQIFAHAGCNDTPMASVNSEIIKTAYTAADASIEAELKSLHEMLKITLDRENTGKKLLSNALTFQVDSIVSLKELDFLQRKDIQIEVQNEK